MDADFSGTLNQEELAEMLRRTYGMNPSPDELSQLIAVCDKSGDGPPTHAHTAAAPTFALCRRCSTRLHAGLIALDEFMLAMATSVELKMAGDM